MDQANVIATIFRFQVMKVGKKIAEREESLAIYLCCTKKESSSNWSHAAYESFKLLSFNGNVDGIERVRKPYVFDSGLGHGFSSFVGWKDWFDATKNYVQNGTINLDEFHVMRKYTHYKHVYP